VSFHALERDHRGLVEEADAEAGEDRLRARGRAAARCRFRLCFRRRAARDSSLAPAFSTSAHAVPSGYLRMPCCATMSARRSGIIIRMPSRPPSTATSMTRVDLEIEAEDQDRGHRHADAEGDRLARGAGGLHDVVLEDRGVRAPIFERMRKSVIEMTATGIEALTVRPTFSTRYSDDAPKIMPRIVPTM
jgi:hypothetical protein